MEVIQNILKFCLIANHKGETIGKALEATIKERALKHIVSITVDNVPSNIIALEYLKNKVRENNLSILGNEFLHVQCAIHILNLIVAIYLRDAHESVVRLRSAVRFVRSSLARLKKFKVFIHAVNIW